MVRCVRQQQTSKHGEAIPLAGATASACTGRDLRSVIWHMMIDSGLVVTYVDKHAGAPSRRLIAGRGATVERVLPGNARSRPCRLRGLSRTRHRPPSAPAPAGRTQRKINPVNITHPKDCICARGHASQIEPRDASTGYVSPLQSPPGGTPQRAFSARGTTILETVVQCDQSGVVYSRMVIPVNCAGPPSV